MHNKELQKTLVGLRRQIHKYPELGDEEFKTTALIARLLNSPVVKIERKTKTGLVAVVKGKKTPGRGRCMAFRADIDGLPIREKTNKPYSSTRNGFMHACGHDANTAIVAGAALLIAGQKDPLPGTAKFIFQPNEESSGGAKQVISAGVLRKPDVDAIVGVHVNPWLKPGTIGLKFGDMMAAVDLFTIELIGEGGHGAYPHMGKDTVVAAAQIIMALQTVVSREIDPVEPAVVTIGAIHGGEAFNVLAGRVQMTGTVRTLNPAVHRAAPRLIEKKIKAICAAYGIDYKFKYEVIGHPLRNSGSILELCRSAGERMLGRKNVVILDKPSMGGEDFAEYLRYVPGCFVFVGAATGKAYPWHNERFDIDESVLSTGAEYLVEVAKEYLTTESKRARE